MSETTRRRAFAVLTPILLVAVLVGLAEIAFRIEYRSYAWEPPRPEMYESYPYSDVEQHPRTYRNIAQMSYDPFLGYIPTPDVDGKGYHTNGQHFRYDDELTEPKPVDEIRVFVTGGSTAWGASVRQDQTYAALVEKRLAGHPQLRGFRVRVIPAGVGAYVSTQERIFTYNHILDYSPDLLVMFTGANDVYEGYRGNRLLRNQDFMEIRRALTRSPDRPVDPGVDPARMAQEDPPRWSDYSSKVVYRVALALHNVRRRLDDTDPDFASQSFPPRHTLSESLRNVHAVYDASRRYDFDFLLYLQPYLAATTKPLADWELELLEEAERRDPGWPEYVRAAYRLYREEMKEDAGQEGYRFVDADAAIAGETEAVFVDDYHFGDRGNRLIADHLYEQIVDLVLECSRTRQPEE